MAESVSEMLRQEVDCDCLLECFHDLDGIDDDIFDLLTASEDPQTIDEIAATIERERSTAYRSVQRLCAADLLEKEQINYDHGGYYHVYQARDSSTIAQEMRAMLEEWYTEVGGLIDEFEETDDITPSNNR
ncbi:helix-turn-helix domain-containing protein [Halocatena halophila]|uniref:helix-turn-helix domain-containing protein n=1 Tax=Halocatena halophila TaxID=2814576 RepID=UPI002ED5E859